ncbi:MAG: Os1348 family NHLP clan protein [Dehalococcoidia bacterium]|nr:Os1348 family NHLP clan protein [Dehalococcoidia bacterium]
MDKRVQGKTEESAEILEGLVNAPAVVPKEGLAGRWAVLSVLARAADEPEFMSRLADDPHEALKEYYTLTQEEKAALASGDIQKIESWVGKLDKRLSTWLLYRLSQEKW